MKKILILISIMFLISFCSNNAYSEPTMTKNAYKISGYINVDSIETQGIKSGFSVKVFDINKELPYSVISSYDGYFQIDNIPENQSGYTLKFSQKGFLERDLHIYAFKRDVDLTSQSFNVDMWVGDISINGLQDNAINMLDAVQIAKCYNSNSNEIEYNNDADLNRDNIANMSDLILIALHYNSIKSSYNPKKL